MHKCNKCNKEFSNNKSLNGHLTGHKRSENSYLKHIGTYCDINDKPISGYFISKPKPCPYCSKQFNKANQLGGHINMCSLNPSTKSIRFKMSESRTGVELSETHKLSISESMKLAHLEGRAWNIGRSRWNNEKSYPEIFFSQVISNEFEDKNYTSEYNVGNYSIDFAWIDKKLAIEIDGDQHQRFQSQIDSDKRKDELLISFGWKVLRLPWKTIFKDTKHSIKLAKDFIHQ